MSARRPIARLVAQEQDMAQHEEPEQLHTLTSNRILNGVLTPKYWAQGGLVGAAIEVAFL